MERSAGAIVFYNNQGIREYLLLYSSGGRGRGYWGFPKGHVEKNETDEEAALRETFEETGIGRLNLIPGFARNTQFMFRRERKLIRKEVILFLVEAKTNKVKLSFEHQDFAWLPFSQAVECLTFPNTKNMLSDADEFLKTIVNH